MEAEGSAASSASKLKSQVTIQNKLARKLGYVPMNVRLGRTSTVGRVGLELFSLPFWSSPHAHVSLSFISTEDTILLLFWVSILLSKLHPATLFYTKCGRLIATIHHCVCFVSRDSDCVDFRTGPCESRVAPFVPRFIMRCVNVTLSSLVYLLGSLLRRLLFAVLHMYIYLGRWTCTEYRSV